MSGEPPTTPTPGAGAGPCPNCGSPATGRFCPACGQRQGRRLVSLRAMAAAALADQFSLESALPRTLLGLLRPGFLTREYLAGRIVRYIPPLRLYLVSSLAFFFALSLTVDRDALLAEARSGSAADSAAAEARQRTVNVQVDPRRDVEALPPLQRAVARYVVRRAEALNRMTVDEFERRFVESLVRNTPRAAFLLIPVFALVLRLLYLRSRRVYAEHFVFSLHVHAFAFLLFTMMVLIPNGWVALALLAALALYTLVAMRAVYGQSRLVAALKYVVLMSAYGVVLATVLLVTALVTAFSL